MILDTAVNKNRYIKANVGPEPHAGVGQRKNTPLNQKLKSNHEERILKFIQLAEQGESLFPSR